MCQQPLPLYEIKKIVLELAYKKAMVNIKKAYLFDDRPLYVGYSGGKDSSVVVDLVVRTLMYLKEKKYNLNKQVYIFTSDTLVEMPHVLKMMHTNLDSLESFCEAKELPIKVMRIKPDYQNRFFSQIIGVGIPLPRQDNRWCTDKMKIQPTEKVMSELLGIDNRKKALKTDEKGEYFIDKEKNNIYLKDYDMAKDRFEDDKGNKYKLIAKETITCQKRKYNFINDEQDCFLDKQKEEVYLKDCKSLGKHLVDTKGNYWRLVVNGNDRHMIACKRVVRRSVVCINGFIAITGSRKDESTARKSRINQATQEGSFLKINQTYKHSNNLLPIEDWSTKDVWNYLFQYSLDWLDDLALWNLYSDASGKGDECSFVGGGDKEVIEDGKVGCAKSRFGCWLCSLFKTDGAMDGLYKANGNMYLPYIEFREYMMKFQGMLSKKTSWAMHRDVYKHDTLGKKYYKKDNDITNPRFGMVMAGGFKLSIRLKLFIKLLRAEQKAKEKLVTDEEILYIQYRWLLEGDINFTAFKAIEKYRGYSFDYKSFKGLNSNVDKWIDTIETFMASKVNPIGVFDSEEYATLTKNRYLVQKVLGKDVRKMFFPTISEENKIRENWENDKVSKKDIQEVIDSGGLEIPIIETLFGEAIDRNKLPQSIYEIITK